MTASNYLHVGKMDTECVLYYQYPLLISLNACEREEFFSFPL